MSNFDVISNGMSRDIAQATAKGEIDMTLTTEMPVGVKQEALSHRGNSQLDSDPDAEISISRGK